MHAYATVCLWHLPFEAFLRISLRTYSTASYSRIRVFTMNSCAPKIHPERQSLVADIAEYLTEPHRIILYSRKSMAATAPKRFQAPDHRTAYNGKESTGVAEYHVHIYVAATFWWQLRPSPAGAFRTSPVRELPSQETSFHDSKFRRDHTSAEHVS